MDKLYDCAKAYKQLMGNEYHIKFFVDNSTRELSLSFSPKEFKHLTGLEKLSDKEIFKNLPSTELFEEILNRRIVFDRNSQDNVNRTGIIESVTDSVNRFKPINNTNKSGVQYFVEDRITELTNLYNLLHNASDRSMFVFKWNRNFSPENRPNRSDINADLLLVFTNSVTQKANDETVCAFFVEEKENNAAAMSIFPTNISYSDDGNVPPLHQCKVLSFEEHRVTVENEIPVKSVTNIIKCSDKEIEKFEHIAQEEKRNKAIKSKIYGLNDTRKKFLKSLEGKIDKNENIKYQSEFAKYQTRLMEIVSSPKIDIETMKGIVSELQDLKNRTNPDEKLKIDSISDEIRIIEDSIEKRIEYSQSISNDIQSPITALSSASSALADDSDNGSSNNTQKISLESTRKQLFDVAQPVFSGQAAGAIALPFPSNQPPLFDISKIITALQALNEKITNAIHSFTDSFSLSHSPKQSAQEQPPQARTAHERKVNSELPFPKQKHADERTEPVKAKPEKYDVKPAEKQSSWIGSLLNSAKSEADEHNKNHEPKAHDKDKSL